MRRRLIILNADACILFLKIVDQNLKLFITALVKAPVPEIDYVPSWRDFEKQQLYRGIIDELYQNVKVCKFMQSMVMFTDF